MGCINSRCGVFQLLSDTVIMLYKEWSNGSRRAIQYEISNTTIAFRYIRNMVLTHLSPVSHFYTPWKSQKTWRVQGVSKCDTGLNGLKVTEIWKVIVFPTCKGRYSLKPRFSITKIAYRIKLHLSNLTNNNWLINF